MAGKAFLEGLFADGGIVRSRPLSQDSQNDCRHKDWFHYLLPLVISSCSRANAGRPGLVSVGFCQPYV
jgi:hypothetical protein